MSLKKITITFDTEMFLKSPYAPERHIWEAFTEIARKGHLTSYTGKFLQNYGIAFEEVEEAA